MGVEVLVQRSHTGVEKIHQSPQWEGIPFGGTPNMNKTL